MNNYAIQMTRFLKNYHYNLEFLLSITTQEQTQWGYLMYLRLPRRMGVRALDQLGEEITGVPRTFPRFIVCGFVLMMARPPAQPA